jgi:metal-responsive CopG/Arc/MetJ family transcriptional regulator
MKRTTIFADEDLINDIKEISREENRSVAEVIREAMVNYIKQKTKKRKTLSFIGVGDSGRKYVAERHEEMLWKEAIK